jgi:hypothetical protein
MTFSITTFSINDTQQVSIYIECNYAECHDLFIVMLNVIMLSVVILNVVAPGRVPSAKLQATKTVEVLALDPWALCHIEK